MAEGIFPTNMKNRILALLANQVFGIRRFNNKCVRQFAKNVHHKVILEIGSGKPIKGKYPYSAKKYFDDNNRFICTDSNPEYGHQVLDVTTMNYVSEFDIILCMNVLEHVYDYQNAIINLAKALKPNGTLLVFVPMFYPLHDEPNDYWRFTEHALSTMFSDFNQIIIKKSGVKQMPIAYFIQTTI